MKRKKMPLFIIIVVAVSLFAQGCATITHGSSQDVLVTNPQGATATINKESCSPTPCVIKDVSRKADNITIRKDGTSKQYTLDKSFNGWSVILGDGWWLPAGIIGIITDYASGAAHTIKPVNITDWQALKTTAAQTNNAGK